MLLKKSKKGFTLVELVIVIAVIAILAAVLVPTFVGVTRNAKKSAALQEATAARTVVLATFAGEDNVSLANGWIKSGEYWFSLDENGTLDTEAKDTMSAGTGTYYKVNTEHEDFSDLKGGEIEIYLKSEADLTTDSRLQKGGFEGGTWTPATA